MLRGLAGMISNAKRNSRVYGLKAAKRQANVVERIHDLEQPGNLKYLSQIRWKSEELQFALALAVSPCNA